MLCPALHCADCRLQTVHNGKRQQLVSAERRKMKFAEMEQTIEALSQQTHNMGQLRNQNNALQVWLGSEQLTCMCCRIPPPAAGPGIAGALAGWV